MELYNEANCCTSWCASRQAMTVIADGKLVHYHDGTPCDESCDKIGECRDGKGAFEAPE